MKKFFMLFFIHSSVVDVIAQDYFQWKGRVVIEGSNYPIKGVHPRSSNQQGLTDSDGYFEILVKKEDRITVTHVAFQSSEFVVLQNALSKNIYLTPVEMVLDQVTVTSMPSE